MADITVSASIIRKVLLPTLISVIGFFLFAIYATSVLKTASVTELIARDDIKAVQIMYGAIPRLAVAIAAGALLGLSTALMQQGLGNPIAEPGTMGVLSAGRLCVAVSLIWLPAASNSFALPVTLGSLMGLLLVIALAWRWRLTPLFLILNGVLLGLVCDAITSILILTHYDDVADLLLWQAGSLAQDNWNVAIFLWSGLLVLSLLSMFVRKPLSLLDLNDDVARSLGSSPTFARLAGIGLAAVGTALVTANIGLLAFVGLAGAALARMCGAHRFSERAVLAAIYSASLLLITDQAAQLLETVVAIPSGTITALFAAPLIIYLLRTQPAQPKARNISDMVLFADRRFLRKVTLGLATGLLVVIVIALTIGRTPSGYTFGSLEAFWHLLPWRWPRVVGSLSAGGMTALAGYLMQRMTGNNLASPELIGVSSGAALVMLPVIFFLPPMSRSQTMLIAAVGALLFLLFALRLAKRSEYQPEKLLLTGLAITAFSGSLLSAAVFFGDLRITKLLGWLSGSTYALTEKDALLSLAILLLAVGTLPIFKRWLSMLPLGEPVLVSLGVGVKSARLAIVLAIAVLTGAATVLIGPVTFVGLLAPHFVRLVGFRSPIPQALACVIVGAGLMVLADWLGRTIAFPWEIPAGLMASVLGAILFGAVSLRTVR